MLDYRNFLVVLCVFGACLVVAFYKAADVTTLRAFALGSKRVSITALVCAIFSSVLGAGGVIGMTGKVYEYGTPFVISMLLAPLQWFIIRSIVGTNINRFNGCVSLCEIMYKSYGWIARVTIAITSIISSFGIISAQALTLGMLFKYFLGIDPEYGVFIAYCAIAGYSALGGITALIHVEIFKFAVVAFALPIAYSAVLMKTGGMSEILSKLPISHIHIDLSRDTINTIAGFVAYALLPQLTPALIQRCLIASDKRQLQQALKIMTLISIPASITICLIAYEMRALAPGIDPDQAFFHFTSMLPPYLSGLVVAGLMAVMMSLAESQVNAASVILVHDLVMPAMKNRISDKNQVALLRLITVVLCFGSLIFAGFKGGILNLLWIMANILFPISTIPIAAAFLGFRGNTASFIGSVATAVLFILLGHYIAGELAITSMVLGNLGSAIGLFSVHFLQESIRKRYIMRNILKNAQKNINGLIIRSRSKALSLVRSIIKLITTGPSAHKLPTWQFCVFTLFYYMFYSTTLTSNPKYKVFGVMLGIGYGLCLILLLRDFVFPKKFILRYMHYYWHVLVTFCIPVVSSYMLFIGYPDPFWVLNSALAAFSFYFFVDVRRFLILYPIGAILGLMIARNVAQSFEHIEQLAEISGISYLYLPSLLSVSFLFRNKEREHEEKIAAMEVFGGAMAHEVRSPLAAIIMCTDTITTIVEKTFKTRKNEGRTSVFRMDNREADTLLELCEMQKMISMGGIRTIDSLLTNMKADIEASDNEMCMIGECINSAAQEYKCMHPERTNKITTKILDDFQFYGSMHYMKQVLFNLLNNTHRYAGPGASVEITTEGNQLKFRDNGKGISEADLPLIFEKFYTKGKSGTGIGLAFCRMVVESIGGSIECKSEPGNYTEFIISLPIQR